VTFSYLQRGTAQIGDGHVCKNLLHMCVYLKDEAIVRNYVHSSPWITCGDKTFHPPFSTHAAFHQSFSANDMPCFAPSVRYLSPTDRLRQRLRYRGRGFTCRGFDSPSSSCETERKDLQGSERACESGSGRDLTQVDGAAPRLGWAG
jgi:hypothetical protein